MKFEKISFNRHEKSSFREQRESTLPNFNTKILNVIRFHAVKRLSSLDFFGDRTLQNNTNHSSKIILKRNKVICHN